MKGTLKPPEIPEKDQSPLVEQLLAFIEHQSIIIQQLKDEIARLKNQPPRPTIKPSRLGKSKKHTSKSSRNKRPGSKKRSKTAQLKIHKTDPIEPDEIPTGSQFRYYKDFVAFIASNAELIRKGFKRWVLVSGITTISLLATAFVWSRHCIFVHYDKCLKTVLETGSFYSICSPNRVPQFYKSLVQYSGVTMYTMIIIGLWFVALRMLFIDKGRKGD
jgi:hypothetical protein